MNTWSAFVLAVLVLLSACGRKETPEDQVRRAVGEAVAAAEKKDVATLHATISDKYADLQGGDKRTVERILRAYFLRNASLHLFSRTSSVSFSEKDRAVATVYVGMATQPVPSTEALEQLRADLYRFDLTFVREGDVWRVVSAEWRSAELGDFVH